MDFQALIRDKSKRNRIIIVFVAAIMVLGLIGFFWYKAIFNFAWNAIDTYLTFLERIADRLLHFFGSGVSIREHEVFAGTEFISALDSTYLLKKWNLFLVLLFWLTPAKKWYKLIYTGLQVLCSVTGSLINLGLTAHLMSLIPDTYTATLMGRTPYVFMMFFLLFFWIRLNPRLIWQTRLIKKLNLGFLEKKFTEIFVVVLVYIFFRNVILGCFQYTIWINFLFNTSAWILKKLEYLAWVEPNLLVGGNGSIYMEKSCLGFNTMLLFASIVFLTGRNSLKKWLFILGGLVLLNISNIIRFVYLFIHLQKHGGYVRELDVHDIYNYVIYAIVFIMWIIWFEKYSYIREKK